jgi:hypothetical protein
LYFRAFGEDVQEILEIDVATRAITPLYQGSAELGAFPLPWSVDDAEEVLTIINAQSNTEVDFAMISLPDGEFIKGLDGAGQQNQPSIAPNGQWLAYAEGDISETEVEINLRPYPNLGRTRIPVGPGTMPVFTRDGSELLVGDNTSISAYPVTYEPTLRIGAPVTVLQSGEYIYNLFGRAWDVDPTGERLLMIRQPGTSGSSGPSTAEQPSIEVVLNWTEELSQRVPVD